MTLENFKYNLQNLERCNQYWDEMKPTTGGRHCAKCSKTIVDFSGMSFSEIAIFMSESKQPVCGFYLPEQLKEIRGHYPKLPVALSISTLMATAAFAGDKKFLQHPIENMVKQVADISNIHQLHFENDILNDSIFISGRVQYFDTAKNAYQPVPFAFVKIKGTNQGTIADANGNFKFAYSTDNSFFVISITSVGFETFEKQVNKDTIQIELGSLTMETYKGKITEFYVNVKRRSFFGRLWRKIKRPFRK